MTKKLFVLAAIAIAVAAVPVTPGDAGEFGRFIEIEKVVVGGGPNGPYQTMGVCTVSSGGTSPIDDGEVIVVGVQNAEPDTCTITETDSLGATSVTYSCTEVPFGDNGATCDDDNTVSWEGDLTGGVHITITNDFTPAPTTTTASTTSTTAPTTTTAAAAAVAIAPTFTG